MSGFTYGQPTSSLSLPSWGTIQTGISTLQSGYQLYNQVSGSNDLNYGGGCPGSPPLSAVQQALATAPASATDKLRQLYAAANSGRAMPSDIFTLTKNCMGGNDCAVSTTNLNSSGNQLKNYFLSYVATYGGNQTVTAAGGDVSTSAQQPSQLSQLELAWRQIWENLKNAAGNVVTSTVGGATAGATASTQGAATGSNVGFQAALPLLVVGGVLVFMLARRR